MFFCYPIIAFHKILIRIQVYLVPNKAQLAWQNAALGALFDYDLHVFDSIKYNKGLSRISPVPDYQIFHPDQLDTGQWIRAAKAMGAKFALLTVTHETGFALFQLIRSVYALKMPKENQKLKT